MMIDIFHTSGLYLFSAASFADARKKCNEQGLVCIDIALRNGNGVFNFYVTEKRAIEIEKRNNN